MTPAPLWLRLGYAAWIAVWIPAYWSYYGPAAFLWFCDLGNLQILAGLWTGRALFYSWAAVSVLLVQLLWVTDVLGRLVAGVHLIGGTQYMWSPAIPLGIRLISLFHAAAPFLLVWGLRRHGYDRRALPLQVATAWLILPLCWLLTTPAQDINWVYGPFDRVQDRLSPGLYLLVCLLAYPLLLHVPTHLALRRLFPPPPAHGVDPQNPTSSPSSR